MFCFRSSNLRCNFNQVLDRVLVAHESLFIDELLVDWITLLYHLCIEVKGTDCIQKMSYYSPEINMCQTKNNKSVSLTKVRFLSFPVKFKGNDLHRKYRLLEVILQF